MKKETSVFKPFSQMLYRFLFFAFLSSLLTSCESSKVIVNGLEEKEANEILVFLAARDINATKVQAKTEGGGASKTILWNISVEGSQANEAMAILNQAGLPRRRGSNLLNIFSNSSLVPSGMQEKIRYQAGLAEQIASTIRKIDGILDADVQISFPDEDPLNPAAAKQKITAAVYVKHSGVLDDPNSHLASRIRRLVAGSVVGLDYDNVTVIPDRARFFESPKGFQGLNEEERPFVNVWTITVAKSSLTRFQSLFFTFTILILLLTLMLAWTLWKLYPFLKESGGIKKLFSLQPLVPSAKKEEKAENKEAEEEPKE